jgi:hypothetical protein
VLVSLVEGFVKYAVEMGSGSMIYIPSYYLNNLTGVMLVLLMGQT